MFNSKTLDKLLHPTNTGYKPIKMKVEYKKETLDNCAILKNNSSIQYFSSRCILNIEQFDFRVKLWQVILPLAMCFFITFPLKAQLCISDSITTIICDPVGSYEVCTFFTFLDELPWVVSDKAMKINTFNFSRMDFVLPNNIITIQTPANGYAEICTTYDIYSDYNHKVWVDDSSTGHCTDTILISGLAPVCSPPCIVPSGTFNNNNINSSNNTGF